MLVLKGLVGLIEPFNFSFFSITGWGIDLDIEWFALEMSRDYSVVFEIASKYCISDSFVDHDGPFTQKLNVLGSIAGMRIRLFVISGKSIRQ